MKTLKWDEYELNILIDNQDKTIRDIQEMLPNRSLQSIRTKNSEMGLKFKRLKGLTIIDSDVQCTSCNTIKKYIDSNFYINKKCLICKECLKRAIYIARYKRKTSIVLDFFKLHDTYNPIEWFEFHQSGLIKKLPDHYADKAKTAEILKYIISEKLKRNSRNDIVKTTSSDIRKFGMYGITNKNFSSWYDALVYMYPHFNIKPFDLKEAPENYWDSIENSDEYMYYIVNKFIEKYKITDFKNQIPPLFSYENLRNLKINALITCIHTFKHYNSMFEWLNKLYPEWGLHMKDFTSFIGCDGKTRLDSLEEKNLYDYIYKNYPHLKIRGIGRSRKNKYVNESSGEIYYPDFTIADREGNKVIVEYFGLYVSDSKYTYLQKYAEKTHRKNEYFSSMQTTGYLDIYPDDLKNNFENLQVKLGNFI